jgi:hypothetical protein
MGAQEDTLLVIPWSESAERPLADARGDSLQAVMPSDSEASPLGSWEKVGA